MIVLRLVIMEINHDFVFDSLCPYNKGVWRSRASVKEVYSALYAFLLGLYVDLISGSPFGLNAGFFTMMSYFINSYANTFKLFSYLQIYVFFGISSVFYIGFKSLIMGIENFSYLVLFVSLLFNTFIFLLISMLRYYFPSMSIKYD